MNPAENSENLFQALWNIERYVDFQADEEYRDGFPRLRAALAEARRATQALLPPVVLLQDVLEILGEEVIEKIKTQQWNVLKMFFGDKTSDIHLCYAIMEIEAWVLGLSDFFELIDEGLTLDFIKKELNLDLENTDPETTIFNPATTLSKIFNLVGKPYGKKQGEIDSIVSLLSKQDYEAFLKKEQCMSFNVFHKAIHSE